MTIGKWRIGLVLLALAGLFGTVPLPGSSRDSTEMPEFTRKGPEAWFNSAPLSRADLKGKVVLLEIWTSI